MVTIATALSALAASLVTNQIALGLAVSFVVLLAGAVVVESLRIFGFWRKSEHAL